MTMVSKLIEEIFRFQDRFGDKPSAIIMGHSEFVRLSRELYEVFGDRYLLVHVGQLLGIPIQVRCLPGIRLQLTLTHDVVEI